MAAASRPAGIPRRASGDPTPLSFSQRRLWFLDQMEPGNPAYNVFRAVILRGALKVEALELSLSEIIRRHEILRTTFPVKDGEPAQRIAAPTPVVLTVRDMSGTPAGKRRPEAEKIAAEQADAAFDLSSDRLLKGLLLRYAQDEHTLVLVTHHIAVDGWSVGILFHELVALYDAFSRELASPLPELPIQFADYALWERRQLSGDKLEREVAYWKHQLAGTPTVLNLPIDRPRPHVQGSGGARYYLHVPGLPLDRLKAIGRREGATIYMVLLAAFQALLARYAEQERFAVGSPMACRESPQLETLIGCFSNTLALRADLSGRPTFAELLRRVRETVVGALAHELLPFDKLVEALNPRRDTSRMAIVQVNFRLLTAPLAPSTGGGLEFEFLEVDNHRSKFDLALELVERSDGLAGFLEYSTELFQADTMPLIASDYEDLLRAVAAAPDTALADLNFTPRYGRSTTPAAPGMTRRKPTYVRVPADALRTESRSARTGRWLQGASKPDSKLRLFCLPHAGGDVSTFAGWARSLPSEVDVLPVLLPGRGARLIEPAFTNAATLVEAMAEALRPAFDREFALLGISTGAILAFELARYLRKRFDLQPAHLFVCCCEAPELPPAREGPIYDLPEPEFLERVRGFGGTPASVLSDPELRQIVLPTLRADFQLRDSYVFVPGEPLACPISAIGGTEDEFATRDTLEAWRGHTSSAFQLSMLPGGHFFFSPDAGQLLRIIAQRCRDSQVAAE